MKKNLFTIAIAMTALAACSCGHKIAHHKSQSVGAMTMAPEMSQSAESMVMSDSGPMEPQNATTLAANKELSIYNKVFFKFDKSNLTPDAQNTLSSQIDLLNKYNQSNVIIEGHCDERGTVEYNIGLGERRANSVKQYLASRGITPSRINTISYGKEKPAVDGHDEASYSQNRRAVTVFVED